jgi:hypothetical protein
MNLSEFKHLLDNPNTISPTQITELSSILKVYPYFQSARSLYVKGLQKHDNIKYNGSLKKTAAYTTDRTVLFDLITTEHFQTITKTAPKQEIPKIEDKKEQEIIAQEIIHEPIIENKLEQSLINSIEIANLEVEKTIENNTIDLSNPLEQSIISSINATKITEEEEEEEVAEDNLTEKEEEKKEEQQLENVETDMSSWLEDKIDEEEEKPISFKKNETHSFHEWLNLSKLKPIEREEIHENNNEDADNPIQETTSEIAVKMDLIDKFIETNPKIVPAKENIPLPSYITKSEDTSYLMTETLAKIYLEQKKYSKAIQAYEILILKYPEKSSLFADRILDIKDLQQNNNK